MIYVLTYTLGVYVVYKWETEYSKRPKRFKFSLHENEIK